MAVYRNDQTEFGFAAEAGPGGYQELHTPTVDAGGLNTTLTVDIQPGDRSCTVAATTSLAVGDYIQVTSTNGHCETRKVVKISGLVVYVDAPFAFFHDSAATGETVKEVDVTGSFTGTSYMFHIPGIWETIEVPDPVMEITPYFHMSTAAKRAFTGALKGRQTFSGSIPSFTVIDASALRFPLGAMATTGTVVGGGASGTLVVDTTTDARQGVKGSYLIEVSAASTWDVGDKMQIDTGSSAEVVEIAAEISSVIFRLTKPTRFAHLTGVAVTEVTTPYTHAISESTVLDSISWYVKNRDTDETAANDIIRKYIGGKVGQATLSASEGGVLTMAWDAVPFLDMVHNQKTSSALSPTPKYSFSAGLSPTISYPTTEPYFFSQGSITMFGVEFARIRNFSIGISNSLEPYYFIRDQATGRIPHQITEGRREYTMSASIALPDSMAAATATTRSLFKELLAEGDYGSGMAGFNVVLVFTRGSSDTITITIPSDGAATTGINEQGAFIRSARQSVATEPLVQAEVDIIFRNMKIDVVDTKAIYA